MAVRYQTFDVRAEDLGGGTAGKWRAGQINGERVMINGERAMMNGERAMINGERAMINGE
jgi:hypothetical protein